MRITSEEKVELIHLLGVLQAHLRSAIEANVIPGTRKAMPEDAQNLAADRRDLRAVKVIRKRLAEMS